jgi:hypothetical protein
MYGYVVECTIDVVKLKCFLKLSIRHLKALWLGSGLGLGLGLGL